MTDKLTPEERKQMHESRSWSCAPEPGERSQAGDAVPCPRCHRGAVMHNSKKPCISCQLKAADARIADLRAQLHVAHAIIGDGDRKAGRVQQS